jgi:hypothetical protein
LVFRKISIDPDALHPLTLIRSEKAHCASDISILVCKSKSRSTLWKALEKSKSNIRDTNIASDAIICNLQQHRAGSLPIHWLNTIIKGKLWFFGHGSELPSWRINRSVKQRFGMVWTGDGQGNFISCGILRLYSKRKTVALNVHK